MSNTLSNPVQHENPAADVNPIIERAINVIGTREEAMRWLGTPIMALNYATPISLLDSVNGFQEVYAVLTKLEHGVL